MRNLVLKQQERDNPPLSLSQTLKDESSPRQRGGTGTSSEPGTSCGTGTSSIPWAPAALMKDQQLQQLNIMIQPTDPSNKNSVATVDNAIKELEQEIIKQAPHSSEIN